MTQNAFLYLLAGLVVYSITFFLAVVWYHCNNCDKFWSVSYKTRITNGSGSRRTTVLTSSCKFCGEIRVQGWSDGLGWKSWYKAKKLTFSLPSLVHH